ncbi:proline-rich protein 7 [Kryptolebias marmoratus]|uniref:proline-rich protein 7 n=1 Tax=Kryptolebias marmoratus TaxID=37003 RepID=UPI0007F8650F|nr:proline-rich protein 7 [Kryptolebias marmoratus]
MVMSQGTYTFLACFAGFWLVWALVVMLCCFCSFLQRRLKRRREERLREQCLRSVEMEPLGCHAPSGYPPAPPPTQPPPTQPLRDVCPPQTLSPPGPHLMPQATWISVPETDVFGKPPCYEEAVLMEDPPPPYSEVLADPRGGTYLKPAPLRAAPLPLRENRDPPPGHTSESIKPPVAAAFPDRGYSSLIRLPSTQRWDSLGHLLSNMDLSPPGPRSLQAAASMATMPRREPRTPHAGIQGLPGSVQEFQAGFQGLHRLRGLDPSCGMPTAFPLLGRSTAV